MFYDHGGPFPSIYSKITSKLCYSNVLHKLLRRLPLACLMVHHDSLKISCWTRDKRRTSTALSHKVVQVHFVYFESLPWFYYLCCKNTQQSNSNEGNPLSGSYGKMLTKIPLQSANLIDVTFSLLKVHLVALVLLLFKQATLSQLSCQPSTFNSIHCNEGHGLNFQVRKKNL